MLPTKPTVQPLPSIGSIMSDSPHRPRHEEFYHYDAYYNSPPMINIAYQSPTIYINQWQGFPPPHYPMHPQYSMSPNYSTMSSCMTSGTGNATGTQAQTQTQTQDMDTSFADNMSSMSSYSFDDFDKSTGGTGTDTENDVKPNILQHLPAAKKKRAAKQTRTEGTCSHCSTKTTTLWRKNDNGALECNACNLYYRRNLVKRPLTLCKDKLATRNRRKPKKESPIPMHQSP